VAQAKRRRFTAEYKQRILAETDQAKGSGGIGRFCCAAKGLYSSLLATWRREREAGVLQALTPQKRGPKSKRDPVAEENQQLRRETQRLTEELRKAEIVIDIQKKVATLLGRPLDRRSGGEAIMDAVLQLSSTVGIESACDVLGVARASFYRQRPLFGPALRLAVSIARPTPARALSRTNANPFAPC
jgi:transposase